MPRRAFLESVSGFTLIEVLVVLLIMGLMVGLASTLLGPDERGRLRVEADRLAQLLDLAATEARLGGHTIAWTADAGGYQFWRADADGRWFELRDNDLLRPRQLPPGMQTTSLQIETIPVVGTPRLAFSGGGASLAFRIDLALGSAGYAITASPIGEVNVQLTAGGSPDALARR